MRIALIAPPYFGVTRRFVTWVTLGPEAFRIFDDMLSGNHPLLLTATLTLSWIVLIGIPLWVVF